MRRGSRGRGIREDQQEKGIKRSRGSRGRGIRKKINRSGVPKGEEDQEEGESGRSTGEGYQEERGSRGRGINRDRFQDEKRIKRKGNQGEDQQEWGIKRSRGSRGRGIREKINRSGVSRGVEDQEEGESGRRSTGVGYQEE
jgi:hypothetical protein